MNRRIEKQCPEKNADQIVSDRRFAVGVLEDVFDRQLDGCLTFYGKIATPPTIVPA
ncbi:MAG: hypothetical protein ACRC10_12920 [Thermoguttaceae bacterium]